MSGLETAVWAALWLALLVLAVLVVAAFRQIERAHASQMESATMLPVGADAPEIGYLGAHGELVTLGAKDFREPGLLIFVSTTCGACQRLMDYLIAEPPPLPATVLVSGHEYSDWTERGGVGLHVRWIATSADARSYYRVNVVPTIYALAGGVVTGASIDGSPRGLEALIAGVRTSVSTDPPARDLTSGHELAR